MNEQSEDLRRLIAGVEIIDVRLIDGASQTRIREDELTESEFGLGVGSRAQSDVQADGTFTVLVRFNGRVTAKTRHAEQTGERQEEASKPPAPLVTYRAVYELRYRAPVGASFAKETLTEFARVNGIFNAWSYWRVFVQSTTAQMGLPIITVPVYRGGRTGQRAAVIEPTANSSHPPND